ncbi:MAG: ArsC family reductase [Mariprofundaceae bacterium]
MNSVEMFGIPNCDTIKKARKWLDAEGIDYQFHNYKKEGVNAEFLSQWCAAKGWEILLNRRGTTWRKLPDNVKNAIEKENDKVKAIRLMADNPSMIKRPVLVKDGEVTVGFSSDVYGELFNL